MQRVVVLGPGASGKSTFAAHLGEITGLPVIELDEYFWNPGLVPTPAEEWSAKQHELAAQDQWILDGDLGPHDVLDVRLRAADTIVVLDFSRWRCAWRAVRRSRENVEFWRWLWEWRRQYRPHVMNVIATQAQGADVHVIRGPRELDRLAAALAAQGGTAAG
jgi:adenylate kinase family enzyme